MFLDKEINEIVDELADVLVDEIGEIKNPRNELNQKVSECYIPLIFSFFSETPRKNFSSIITTREREGNVFSRVCLSTGQDPCNHYP